MTRTTVFRSNRTQAVRLPKGVALPESVTEVDITIVGESRVITPADATWDHWHEHAPLVTEDFLVERDQPAPQERG